jgi:hypothetical protein
MPCTPNDAASNTLGTDGTTSPTFVTFGPLAFRSMFPTMPDMSLLLLHDLAWLGLMTGAIVLVILVLRATRIPSA